MDTPGRRPIRDGRASVPVAVGGGLVVLAAAAIAATALGSVSVAPSAVVDVLRHHLFGGWLIGGRGPDPVADQIVWSIRLPRVLLAMLVGAALTTAGTVVQALVRNALADPFLLGISSGASVGATTVLLFGALGSLGLWALSVGSIAGALAAMVAVFAISREGGKLTPTRLILSGVALGAMCEALTSFLLFRANPQATDSVLFWLLGSFGRATWGQLWLPAVALVLGVAYLLVQARSLNALAIGEETATSLGIDVRRLRRNLFLVTSLIAGVAVAVSGVIGFVGLVIPHIVRLAVGTDHRRTLPVGLIWGAAFMVVGDLLARTIVAPQEMPMGVITVFVGGPVFLWLMRRRQYQYGDDGMSLEVRGLQVDLGGTRIVEDVSFTVPSGTFAGLLGPNGSGKSTVLRSIYRSVAPVGGSVLLDDHDVAAMGARELAQRLAVVSQETVVEFDVRVHEMVLLGRIPHQGRFARTSDRDRDVVADALHTVGCRDLADRSYHTLSGGERQRVLVARALAQEVDHLILDEPTNHLDIRYQMEILDFVAGLGVTVLAALHDLSLASLYCDQLHLLSSGRLCASGAPADVVTEDRVREVYGADVLVVAHPETGTPQLMPRRPL